MVKILMPQREANPANLGMPGVGKKLPVSGNFPITSCENFVHPALAAVRIVWGGKERGTLGDDEGKMFVENGAAFVDAGILPDYNEYLRDSGSTRNGFRSGCGA